MRAKARPAGGGPRAQVRLTAATADGDDRILAALLHTVSGRGLSECLTAARKMPARRKRALYLEVFERMEFFDFPPREFEHADLSFELVLSASAFAQLKRHRMATLTVQDYDPGLGTTVPPSIGEAGAADEFRKIVERTEEAYRKLKPDCGRPPPPTS